MKTALFRALDRLPGVTVFLYAWHTHDVYLAILGVGMVVVAAIDGRAQEAREALDGAA